MAQYAQYGAPIHGSMPMQGDAAPNSSGMLGPPGRGDPSTTVFVGNISYDVPVPQIEALLREAGTIVALRMKHDPTPGHHHKGWGFCTYANPMEAQRAIQTLNDRILGGRNVRVKPQTGSSRGGAGGGMNPMPPSLPMGGMYQHGGYNMPPQYQSQHAPRGYGAPQGGQAPMAGGSAPGTFALQPLGGGAALGSARPSYARAAPMASSAQPMGSASLAGSDRPMLAPTGASAPKRAPAILGGGPLGPGAQGPPRLDGQSVAQRLGAYELWCSLGEAREVARRDPASMRALLQSHPELCKALLLGMSRLGLLRKETAAARAEARKRGDVAMDASIIDSESKTEQGAAAPSARGGAAGGAATSAASSSSSSSSSAAAGSASGGAGAPSLGGGLLGSTPGMGGAGLLGAPPGNNGGAPPAGAGHPHPGAPPMPQHQHQPPPGMHYGAPPGPGPGPVHGGYGAPGAPHVPQPGGYGAPPPGHYGHAPGGYAPMQGGPPPPQAAPPATSTSSSSSAGAPSAPGASSSSGAGGGPSASQLDEEIVLMMDILKMSDADLAGFDEEQRQGMEAMRKALMTPSSQIEAFKEPERSEVREMKQTLIGALQGAGVNLSEVQGLQM